MCLHCSDPNRVAMKNTTGGLSAGATCSLQGLAITHREDAGELDEGNARSSPGARVSDSKLRLFLKHLAIWMRSGHNVHHLVHRCHLLCNGTVRVLRAIYLNCRFSYATCLCQYWPCPRLVFQVPDQLLVMSHMETKVFRHFRTEAPCYM